MKVALSLAALALALPACSNGASPPPEASPSATTAAAPPSARPAASTASSAAPASSAKVDLHGAVLGVPYPAADIVKAVNPKNVAPYSGPTGTLKGTIHVEGDPPPDVPNLKIPVGKCGEAAATYGKLFRVGLGKTLGDAMVAVTGYDAYVPEREEAAKITIHGCAYAKRTLAATYGQRVEVSNLDPLESYMPLLNGAPNQAVMVAVPQGAPVKLYPQQPGHYRLQDELPKPFMTADVFVLAFATHDVTGLDGQYEIKGIPVGKVKVNAFLPVLTGKAAEEQIFDVKAGDNTLDFTIKFDKSKDLAGASAAAAASASAGAGPKK